MVRGYVLAVAAAFAVVAVTFAAAAGGASSSSSPSSASSTPSDAQGAKSAAPSSKRGGFKPLRILSIMTIDTMSHHIWMSALTVELARRGHLVTSVDINRHKDAPPTLNTSVIETAFVVEDPNYPQFMQRWMKASVVEMIGLMNLLGEIDCNRDLASPTMRRLIDPSYEGGFDLILVDYMADCLLGFIHRFNNPGFIVVSPFPGSDWIDELMGNPQLGSLFPWTMRPFPHPMSLWQRAWSTFLRAYHKLQVWWWRPAQESILRKFFGEDVPSAQELRDRVHLALVNENPILEPPRPLTPSIIPVGGMHVKPANISNIPEDLRKWIDDSPNGFIYLSFGSIMRGANLDIQKKRALVESFRVLSGVRVLWKIEPEAVADDDLPANVRVSSWMPQNDILGHPKLRLFVSHCGGLSTQEAAYHGVPILGVPFIVDQFINLEKVVKTGMGRRMPYQEITPDRVVAEINEMLTNPKYREAALHMSVLIHDQKETPLERAVWWAEYIGRHRSAPHLRSYGLDLPWYQVMLIDVWALLVLAVLAMAAIGLLLVSALVRWIRRDQKRAEIRRAKNSKKKN